MEHILEIEIKGNGRYDKGHINCMFLRVALRELFFFFTFTNINITSKTESTSPFTDYTDFCHMNSDSHFHQAEPVQDLGLETEKIAMRRNRTSYNDRHSVPHSHSVTNDVKLSHLSHSKTAAFYSSPSHGCATAEGNDTIQASSSNDVVTQCTVVR